ncbi:hypothetical protein [Paenibacillus sp. JDR-2]|uniref:hypothetical protein n=1 Tax=Paenibacillus sp. (strain JDR-2) TaxID=324057 RepID=UPI00016649B6|nr:hypothetical protein [Paenibacillus sp. JDR-2]ACT03860.1 hypothetical protein Pjdr2_5249 [Paenibacillus sp. JDR-2]
MKELSESVGEERIRHGLQEILHGSESDFIAFAGPAGHHGSMKWIAVIGSLNGKVEHMRIQPGIGIGGTVLRHGTVCLVNGWKNTSLLRECPVILAEKLVSALGLPVPGSHPYYRGGIVLLGRRKHQPFTEEEAQRISSLLLKRGGR